MSITEEYPELEAVIERCVIGGLDRAEAEHLISSLVNYSTTEPSHYPIKDNFGGACPKSNIAQKQSFRTFVNKRARKRRSG